MRCCPGYGVFLSVVLLSTGALAEPPSPEARTPAEAHRRDGDRAAAARRWDVARAKYQEALRLAEQESVPPAQRAELLGALGLAELSLGRFRDAAEHLSAALDSAADTKPSLRDRWQEGLNRAAARIGRLYIGVSPPDAVVELDGGVVGSSRRAYLVYVEPGEHAVRAHKEGLAGVVQTVEVDAGEARSLSFRLEAASRPPESAAVPAAPVPVPAAPVPVPAAPVPSATPRGAGMAEVLQGTGFTLMLLGAVLGTGFVIASEDSDDAVDREKAELAALGAPPNACALPAWRARCQPLNDALEGRSTMDRAALVSFLAGGAIGGATALWYFWPAEPGPGPAPAVRVRATPGGISVQGVW